MKKKYKKIDYDLIHKINESIKMYETGTSKDEREYVSELQTRCILAQDGRPTDIITFDKFMEIKNMINKHQQLYKTSVKRKKNKNSTELFLFKQK